MRGIISLLVFLSLALSSKAQLPARPDPPRLYNNLSKNHPDFLSAQEADQLEQKLESFSNETSNQICVVVVDELGGYEPSDYATKLINTWGVGKKEANNGIVVLLQLNPERGGRDFIAVGYGLEGAIPDLATKRIRDEDLEPNLKQGQNFAALDQTTERLMQLAKGEINVKDYAPARKGRSSRKGSLWIVVIIIIFIISKLFGGGGGTTFSRGGRRYWGAGLGSAFGSGFGGGFGGGSSGGGFGGFGGGRSGGGGSGGSW